MRCKSKRSAKISSFHFNIPHKHTQHTPAPLRISSANKQPHIKDKNRSPTTITKTMSKIRPKAKNCSLITNPQVKKCSHAHSVPKIKDRQKFKDLSPIFSLTATKTYLYTFPFRPPESNSYKTFYGDFNAGQL